MRVRDVVVRRSGKGTIEEIRPPGVPLEKQRLVLERPVWRLHNGRAVLVGYRLFDAPGSKPPAIPGVTPRCEFGIEILVVLALLVYLIGISLDKACVLLQFFCQLPIRKSQADALLRRLGTGRANSRRSARYANQFAAGQKCWAHLLRKAIRLSLLYPRNRKYKRFLDQLLTIYRDGKRAAADGRLGEAGRQQRIAELEGRLCELCKPYWHEPRPDCPPTSATSTIWSTNCSRW